MSEKLQNAKKDPRTHTHTRQMLCDRMCTIASMFSAVAVREISINRSCLSKASLKQNWKYMQRVHCTASHNTNNNE